MARDRYRNRYDDEDYEDRDYRDYDEDDDREYRRPRRKKDLSRADMILILGILSLVLCAPIGIAAWIMGHNDLAEMNAGRMSRAGEGSTRTGYILGIVGTLLFALGMILACLWFVAVTTLVTRVGSRGF